MGGLRGLNSVGGPHETEPIEVPDGGGVSEGDNNFFSRWSRRKIEVREVREVREGALGPVPAPPAPLAQVSLTQAPVVAERRQPSAPAPSTSPAPPSPPAPTLADVDALTTQSDYTRFVGRDVAPEVKRAALKKLFTDPHFNVMDGLDTYIDDYGKPDPLPPGMLRKMMQSQLLGLFDHEKKVENPGDAVAASDAPVPDAGGQAPPQGEEPTDPRRPPGETSVQSDTPSIPPPADP